MNMSTDCDPPALSEAPHSGLALSGDIDRQAQSGTRVAAVLLVIH